MLSDLLGLYERLQVHQRLMSGLDGPHPLLHRVGPVTADALAGPPVPDHVPGVLRVGEHVADARVGPVADRGVGQDGGRGRVERQVRVQPVSDRLIAERSTMRQWNIFRTTGPSTGWTSNRVFLTPLARFAGTGCGTGLAW